MKSSAKKAETLKAIRELGQKLAALGAERGHWLMIDVRKLHDKVENLWSEDRKNP